MLGDHGHTIAMRLKALILITALLIAPHARAVDPQPYTLHIDSTGHSALDAALKASSQLESLRTSAPAGPFALIGRAEADVERLRIWGRQSMRCRPAAARRSRSTSRPGRSTT
jgi:hypothetical protein